MNEDDSKTESSKSSGDKNLKGISHTPVITSIFKPTADLIGEELKKFVKTKIDHWKEEKRSKNIIGHIKVVQKKLKNSSNVELDSIQKLELFEDWIDGSQDVDPEEEILASLWQALLIEIAKGKSPDRILVSKLKSLDINEAKMFLIIAKGGKTVPEDRKEKYYFSSLEKKGLVEKSYRHLLVRIPFFLWLIAVFVVPFLTFKRKNIEISFISSILNNTPMVVLFFVITLVAIVLIFPLFATFFYGFVRWRPTWIGIKLASYSPDINPKTNLT